MANFTRLISILAYIALSLPSAAQASEAGTILGTWLVEDYTGRIEIFRCKDKYCGKTVWIKASEERPHPEKILDIHNPNPEKRNQKIIGKTILWGLTFNPEEGNWEGGYIYDSRQGKVYRCEVSMASGGQKLLLRGFLGISLIGKTTVWTRFNR